MALPFSRNTTYVAGSQVKSVDLNALQDGLASQRNRTIHIAAAGWQIIPDPSKASAPTFSYGGSIRQTSGMGFLGGRLDLSPWIITGDIIKEITFRWRNGATPAVGTFDGFVIHNDVATNPYDNGTQIGALATQDVATGGASVARTALLSLNHTVLANNTYAVYFELNAAAGNDQAGFGGISLVLGV